MKRTLSTFMKTALLSLAACFLVGCKEQIKPMPNTVHDDVIVDPLLKKVINKNLGSNRSDNQKITIAELETLTEISSFLKADGSADFSENAATSILGTPKSLKGTPDFKFATTYGIKSIKGLEYAKNLQKLKLNENEIKDISPLAKLTKLTYLELQRNRITDVTPLKDLVNLTFLKLYNNLIEDITPLKNLTNLEDLDIHYNVTVDGDEEHKIISKGITDISIVENMKNLTFLDVSANRITDIKVLKKLDKIEDLDFSGNMVTDYTDMADYIIPRYVKQQLSGEGSINFYAQTVEIAPLQTEGDTVLFESPFKGIEELSKKLCDAMRVDDPTIPEINFFKNADLKKIEINGQKLENSTFEYNESDKKFKVKFDSVAYNMYANSKQSLKLTVSYEEMPWYIVVPVQFGEPTEIVATEYKNFYFNFFNKWSNSEQKYINLTDDANKRFSKTNKPKTDTNFTKDDFAMLKKIIVKDRAVTDTLLSPLKYAYNLENFEVLLDSETHKRNVTDFYFLKSMPKLKIFYYLQQANVNLNERLPNIDFSNNMDLEDVRICKTNLSNLQFLKNLNLVTVSLQDNKIKDISVLANMSKLERIDLDNNQIVELCDFTKLTNLVTLYLRDNQITDISKLEPLKTLEALHLRKTKVSDISILKKLPKLHRLYIDKNDNLAEDYFSIIKELSGLNTLCVGTITVEEFEWLKTFAIRDAVPAKFDEDAVRLFSFDKLSIDIPQGSTSIANPLKDWNGASIIQADTNENGDNIKNENLTFNGDTITITPVTGHNSEKYEIYIENGECTFGKYGQSASIAGTVELKLKSH